MATISFVLYREHAEGGCAYWNADNEAWGWLDDATTYDQPDRTIEIIGGRWTMIYEDSVFEVELEIVNGS